MPGHRATWPQGSLREGTAPPRGRAHPHGQGRAGDAPLLLPPHSSKGSKPLGLLRLKDSRSPTPLWCEQKDPHLGAAGALPSSALARLPAWEGPLGSAVLLGSPASTSYLSILTRAGMPPDLKMESRPSRWCERLCRMLVVQRAVSRSLVLCMVRTTAATICGDCIRARRDASFLESWLTIMAALLTTTLGGERSRRVGGGPAAAQRSRDPPPLGESWMGCHTSCWAEPAHGAGEDRWF